MCKRLGWKLGALSEIEKKSANCNTDSNLEVLDDEALTTENRTTAHRVLRSSSSAPAHLQALPDATPTNRDIGVPAS